TAAGRGRRTPAGRGARAAGAGDNDALLGPAGAASVPGHRRPAHGGGDRREPRAGADGQNPEHARSSRRAGTGRAGRRRGRRRRYGAERTTGLRTAGGFDERPGASAAAVTTAR